jgi:hypothetical protein
VDGLTIDMRPSKDDLRRWIGKDVLVLRQHRPNEADDVTMRVHWGIEFDWTGEAQSKVWCDVSVPSAWKKVDRRGSLKNVGRTFDGIVREKGVSGAVGVMVGLFFQDE